MSEIRIFTIGIEVHERPDHPEAKALLDIAATDSGARPREAGGLVATARRAQEELRVTGAKIRRAESSGIDSLTPSERRIVELATDGASNPEIAQALFVTVKTVEMHLGNAYRKLGINSRRQLATLLPVE